MKIIITSEQFEKLQECDGCATTTNSGNYAYESPFGAKPIKRKKKKSSNSDEVESIAEEIMKEIIDPYNFTYTTVANIKGGKRMYNAYNNKEDFKKTKKKSIETSIVNKSKKNKERKDFPFKELDNTKN